MNVTVILKDRVFAPADCMVTLMELQRLDQQSFQPNVCLDQNKCLRVSALEKQGMGIGRVGKPETHMFIFFALYKICGTSV